MRRGALSVLALGLLAAPACRDETLPPLGQVKLHVTTDAILPPAPGASPRAGAPAPLFDRLRIELFRPNESEPCAGCTREFGLDESMVDEGRASMGITPTPHVDGYRARVRIYWARAAQAGAPPPHVTLEQVVALPPADDEGIVDVTVTLLTDEIGRPVGTLDRPGPVALGAPTTKMANTWPGAARVDCTDRPPPGEVCVPGGAFWMGDPRTLSGAQLTDDPQRVKLVVVSPFHLDATEVTVRDFRASGLEDATALQDKSDSYYLFPGDPMFFPDNIEDLEGLREVAPYYWCNYTQAPNRGTRDGAPLEDMPVNCITQPKARAYCLAKGADLPSEAQFEYVAGALESRPFVWGSDDPTCDDAVWGRSGLGKLRVLWGNCRAATEDGGPRAPRSGARDRLELPTGTIFDLVGNVVEWTRDVWARSTEPCWAFSLAKDPVCTTPSTVDREPYVTRGGSWAYPGVALRSTFRQRVDGSSASGAFGGFRCARPAARR